MNGKKQVLQYTICQEYILISILVFYFAFRGFVSWDWDNYYLFYDVIPDLFDGFNAIFDIFNAHYFENGFILYAVICKTVSTNYFFFQAISSIIDICILYFFFKTYIPDKIVLGFIFFYLFQGIHIEMNLLRNSKAIMLFLLSIKYMNEKKILSYVGLNLIGVCFHTSSILFLPLYFILNRKYPRPLIILLFIIGNFIFFLSVEWVTGLLDGIAGLFDIRLFKLIAVYLNSDSAMAAKVFSIGYLERVFSFFAFVFVSKKLTAYSRVNIVFINSLYIYVLMHLYLHEMYILIERVALLFIFSYWVLYPQLYKYMRKNYKALFLIVLFIYGSLKLCSGQRAAIDKYENILFSHRDYYQYSRARK
jgi:hypothetical protein